MLLEEARKILIKNGVRLIKENQEDDLEYYGEVVRKFLRDDCHVEWDIDDDTWCKEGHGEFRYYTNLPTGEHVIFVIDIDGDRIIGGAIDGEPAVNKSQLKSMITGL